jgi:hypothetical protein
MMGQSRSPKRWIWPNHGVADRPTVFSRITTDSVEHNNSFIQRQLNIFRPNGTSSGWQEWKINTQFRIGIEIYCDSGYLKHNEDELS